MARISTKAEAMIRKRTLLGSRFRPAVAVALLLGAFGVNRARAQTYQILHSFEPPPGQLPYAGLIADSSGNFYGTTFQGGEGLGTVFKLDASNGYALTTLHSFTYSDGAYPQAALIADSSGNLYGTTNYGGASGFPGYGTVFKLDASNGYALTTLHSFANSDGAGPSGGLIADSAGNLYGPTFLGGGSGCDGTGCGTVFKLDASNGYGLTTLHSFANSDGAAPSGGLIADSSGNLYGTTYAGGASGYGTVFKLDASNGYALTTLHAFANSDGSGPVAGLIADSSGNLYGTTAYGGSSNAGTVFKLDASNSYALTTLHSFGGSDGVYPYAALIADPAGNLYGTTYLGGTSNLGTVFRLDASNGYSLTTLHSFTSSDGAGPLDRLIADSSSNLYGTTAYGGSSNAGTVFKLDASNGYALTMLHSFAYTDGAGPLAGLIADSSGNLYGTTAHGGASGYGAVFKLDALNGYALTTLHDFVNADGANPYAALIADLAGNLYGTTYSGGASGYGTAFKLDASNGYALTTPHSFTGSDGAYPHAALMADSAGNLFGTTTQGGASGYGTVSKLDASNGYALTTLHDFSSSDGANPYAALIADSAGNLYGTTFQGGAGYGTVFKLDASNSYALTTLHSFAYSDGANPQGALIADSAGNLYGTTYAGGAPGYGTAFKLDASNGYALTTLHSFVYADGANPNAALIADSWGNLYGTTQNGGGSAYYGTVFELDASNGYALTTLHSFAGYPTDGAYPYSAVIADSAGNLYGTTYGGGTSGTGVVFRVTLCSPPTPTPTITAPSWVVAGTTALMASVTNHSGSIYNWTLSGGRITAGQGSDSILFDAGAAGTTMRLSVVETLSAGCPSLAGTRNVQVDFLDVPTTDPFHDFVDTIARNGITVGCGGGNYCPDGAVTRTQMAVFLLKSKYGATYVPPPATETVFADVPANAFAAAWIEELHTEGIAAGCGGGNYCPNNAVTRAQMAVFLLRAEHGSTYAPPACAGIFTDVTCTPGVDFSDWIERLYGEGITAGCSASPPLYCPNDPNTRGQMAVFLVKTFGLQ